MEPKATTSHQSFRQCHPLTSATLSSSLQLQTKFETDYASSSSPPPMDAIASKNHVKDVKKMSRGGGRQQECQSHSFWGAMALKNRRQSGEGRGAAAESKNSSSKKMKTKRSSISISRSMTCAGSICSTKESAVLSRGGSRRSSTGGGASSSRSLKAPDNDGAVSKSVSASGAAVSASSSFNSETTVGTATTTASSSSTLSSTSAVSSPLSSIGTGSRSFRKLSGCYYECHSAAALDPRTSLASAAMLPCADCDEAFMNAGSLELHRSTRHAVSELGADDTSRKVVEIIFQSSWRFGKLPVPAVCRVERVLKVRSSGKTVERFEQYRERVKARAGSSGGGDELAKKNYPRCAADGNELLRFHCTTFTCSLGLASATALCTTSPAPAPHCKLCSILRDGFSVDGDGRIATMATSGRAHDTAARVLSPDGGGGEKRAMLVCRVVAGRVKIINGSNSSEEFGCDSVSSCSEGVYSDLDELFVFNPRAILPCFVVIYSGY